MKTIITALVAVATLAVATAPTMASAFPHHHHKVCTFHHHHRHCHWA